MLTTGHVYVIRTNMIRQTKTGDGPSSKDKICLCVCIEPGLFFWFNTNAAHHNIAQLDVSGGEAPAIVKKCFLDLSRITTFSASELAAATDRGPITKEFALRVSAALAGGVKTLAPKHARIAIDAIAAFCSD